MPTNYMAGQEIIAMYPIVHPDPRLLLIRTQGIEVYKLKDGVMYKYIEMQDKIQACSFYADHKFGSLIAAYMPASGCVDIYEPVCLIKLRSVRVIQSAEEWVTAVDVENGDGLLVGYRSGRVRFYDLKIANSTIEFGGTEAMSGVTHMVSIPPA